MFAVNNWQDARINTYEKNVTWCYHYLQCLFGLQKKNEQSGSPYTKQITATWTCRHIAEFQSPPNIPKHDTDTVALNIQYVNDATVEINSLQLTYSPNSTDSQLIFEYSTPGNTTPHKDATLRCNRFTNTIYYNLYDFVSSGGQTNDTYWTY